MGKRIISLALALVMLLSLGAVAVASDDAAAAGVSAEAENAPAEPTEQPVEEPVEVTAPEPVEATEEPVEATAEPVEATAEPVEATAEPVEATAEPVEATEEPVVAAEVPVEAAETPTYTVAVSGAGADHIKMTVNGVEKTPPFTITDEENQIEYELDEGFVIDYGTKYGTGHEPGKLCGYIGVYTWELPAGATVTVNVREAKKFNVSVADTGKGYITLYLDGVQQGESVTMWEYQDLTYVMDQGYVIDDNREDSYYDSPNYDQDEPGKIKGHIVPNQTDADGQNLVVNVRPRQEFTLNIDVEDGADPADIIQVTADGEPVASGGKFWEDAVVRCTLLDTTGTYTLSRNGNLGEYYFNEEP